MLRTFLPAFWLWLAVPSVWAGSPPAISAPDPRGDGWDTEAVAEALGTSLKKLAADLTAHQTVSPVKLLWADKPDKSTIHADFQHRVFPEPTATKPPGDWAAWQTWLRGSSGTGNAAKLKFKTLLVELPAAGECRGEHAWAWSTTDAENRQVEWNGTLQLAWRLVSEKWVPQSGTVTSARATVIPARGLHFLDRTGQVTSGMADFPAQYGRGNTHWKMRVEQNQHFFVFGLNGMAIGDVDGDGREDIYSCQPGGMPNRLLLHQPDASVRDAALAAGVNLLDCSQAALLVDLDADGDLDLAVSTTGPLLLFSNDGKGKFTKRQGLPTDFAYHLAAADYDLDGDLDLYACRYYQDVSFGENLPVPVPPFDAQNGGRNVLWKNTGKSADGWVNFADATQESGLEAGNNRWSYAAVWDDFNDDGWPDLYVANDFGRNSLYLRTLLADGKPGPFQEVSAAMGLEKGAFGMSASTGDVNRDGRLDLHLGAMWSSAGHRITRSAKFAELKQKQAGRFFDLAQGNRLFVQNAEGTAFTDESSSAGSMLGRWSWGCLFADVNNDGWEDLLVANGFVSGEYPDDL